MTKIVLVCEAWGAREMLFEHALVGYSGFELSAMLNEVGLAPRAADYRPSEYEMIAYWKRLREDFGIEVANVFNAKPEGNDITTFFTNRKEGDLTLPPLKTGKFLRPELRFHVEQLWDLISRLNPNLCVAFGNTACWALLGQTKISALRGTVLRSERLGVKVLPTYHPAAVLRQWNLRPIVLTDLEKAKREAETSVISRIKRWLLVNPTLAEICQWLNLPAKFYSVDIENNASGVTMVGFARSHDDAMVIPFFDPNRPGGNYWPTVEDEVQAWKLLGRALEKPVPKIFQNGIYDLTHLVRLGLRPTMCDHDTMLLHHALYPEMLKGLGFLGSIYSDERPWKLMRGKGDTTTKRDA